MKKGLDISSINKVFEVERGGELYYQILHTPTGFRAEVEHDDGLIDALLTYAKETGRSLTCRTYKGSLCGFRFVKSRSRGTAGIQLAAFAYAYYHGISLEDVRKLRIQHSMQSLFEDGVENCHKDNLAATDTPTAKTSSRELGRVEINGYDCLRLHFPGYGVTEYFEWSEGLFNLLSNRSVFTLFPNKAGRVQARMSETVDGELYEPYISQIAYAYYKGLLNVDNVQDIRSILCEMTHNGEYNVDHVNGDIHNNCPFNLCMIPNKINQSKKDLTKRFFPPHYLWVAYDTESDEYIWEYNLKMGEVLLLHRNFKCKDAETLINWMIVFLGDVGLTGNFVGTKASNTMGAEYAAPTPMVRYADAKAQGEENVLDSISHIACQTELLKKNRETPEHFTVWLPLNTVNPGVHEFMKWYVLTFKRSCEFRLLGPIPKDKSKKKKQKTRTREFGTGK